MVMQHSVRAVAIVGLISPNQLKNRIYFGFTFAVSTSPWWQD
jgi:hypothetical protein